jgi:hypothetical protein
MWKFYTTLLVMEDDDILATMKRRSQVGDDNDVTKLLVQRPTQFSTEGGRGWKGGENVCVTAHIVLKIRLKKIKAANHLVRYFPVNKEPWPKTDKSRMQSRKTTGSNATEMGVSTAAVSLLYTAGHKTILTVSNTLTFTRSFATQIVLWRSKVYFI